MERVGSSLNGALHKLGYLVPEFPGQTHVFFWREVQALREMGVAVRMISTRRPTAACRHEFADAAAAETHYLWPARTGAAAWESIRRAGGVARATAYVAGLRESSVKQRMKYLGLIACAADLVELCGREGIGHVHGHSCADAAHLLAIAKLMGGPTYSLTLHGDLPVYGADHRAKMAGATVVSTAGGHLKPQVVERAGYPAERVVVSCMGLDTRRFTPGEKRYEAGPLHVATVARLDACKGHKHALAAVRRAVDAQCDVRYSIAGAGGYREEIAREVERLGLTGRVEMLGTVGQDGVLELLRRVDAFVLPSVGLGEAYPVSVMEAMACGVVPVVVDYGGPGELVEAACGVKVPMGTRGEIVARFREVISGLCEDRQRLREMSAAGMRRVRDRFTWDAKARRVVGVYRRCREAARADKPPLAHVPAVLLAGLENG